MRPPPWRWRRAGREDGDGEEVERAVGKKRWMVTGVWLERLAVWEV